MIWKWDYRDVIWDFERGRDLDHYNSWAIKKRNGRRRWIHSPRPRLKELQRLLNQELLPFPVHPASKAFLPGTNHIQAAQEHLEFMDGHGWLFKTDIKDFFGHVSDWLLRQCNLDSTMIQMITVPHPSRGRVLPQGGVTSPMASNLVMYRFDEIISSIAAGANLHYTRYADDIAISGRYNFGYRWAYDLLSKHLQPMGLFLSQSKTKMLSPGARQVYLGVVLNPEGLRVQAKSLDNLKARLNHLTHGRDHKDSVHGVLAYVKQVNPGQWQKMVRIRNKLNGAIL